MWIRAVWGLVVWGWLIAAGAESIPDFPVAQLPAPSTSPLPLLQARPLPVPGGVAVIALASTASQAPELRYQGERVLVLLENTANGSQWVALVGLPLDTKPGIQQIQDRNTAAVYQFEVRPKRYERQDIQLKNKRQVNPNPQDLVRIQQETQRIQAALAQPWRDIKGTEVLPLRYPVQGRKSSPFGLQRYFNNEARKPHSGLDLAAPQGTPVLAPASGVVVEVGDYFFNGNTVFIDHGQGLLTMYCHLSEITVKPGQYLHTGEMLGRVGMTGRSTGPHLHWGVRLNNTWIDPEWLLEKSA